MTTRREASSYSTMIFQKATTAFDGTLPAGDAPLTDGLYRYAPAANGGLVYWEASEPVVVNQLSISLTSAGNVTIHLVNLDATMTPIAGEIFPIAAATGVTYWSDIHYELVLLPNQAMQIITTKPGSLITAAAIERTFYH